ncbi:uncharacterized protein EV154DRAFT_582688 [Mucor mucedo]|uniref:uncharacterized protein n=1 Tax=Mucor mucedo TaxID=29922 RepID=UPI0022208AB3|nr:uncharacterized protein EV154DRAFT_582688 [Mucor mucedo]KAI7867628.1 hypothetical protein EV154DRAFT_582688 [Mucor mucedo]
MDEEFNYSRNTFCLVFALDQGFLYTKALDTDGYFEPAWSSSKTVIAEGDATDEFMRKIEKPQEKLFYVPNAFNELYDTYLKQQEENYGENELYDVVLQEWIIGKKIDCSEAEFCYAFAIPTGWNDNTREELIRPLFVKSRLINEDNNVRQLYVFNQLELNFRYLQSGSWPSPSITAKQGHQYIIMYLDSNQEVDVNLSLSLVSACYPDLKTVDSQYIPQLLKGFDFKIPFGSHKVKSSLTTCLENFCDSKLVLEIIDQMLETINEKLEAIRFTDRFSVLYRPFLKMDLEYSCDSKYSIEEFELMLQNIRSLTLEDVFDDWFHSAVKIIENGINTLLQGTNNIKAKSLVCLCTDYFKENSILIVTRKLVEKWVKTYVEKQESLYKLIRTEKNCSYNFSAKDKMMTAAMLVRRQMDDFNIYRDPIILPKDSLNGQYERTSKPVYFINIDLLPSQNKITLTYVDEKSRVKRTENVDCNIQPLDAFFKQSESYQRPQLHMNNRLKKHVEKMFAEYLIMYSKSGQQKTSSRLIQPKNKTTFGSCFGIKTSENWPKEIRNFFASSSPHLLEQVMHNLKMDDLFMKNNSSHSEDTDLLLTSDPGYILFFIIAYLHNLNMWLEKELNEKFKNGWRDKNTVWKNMQSDYQIDYCITHKDKKNTKYDFDSFQAYRDILQILKQRIIELLNISDKCSCQMVISLRLVIEKGLQPVIETTVTTMAATLTNYNLFGYYKMDYLFLLGDPFNLIYGSPLYNVYTTILQRPNMFNRFIHGTLCQVPNSTYLIWVWSLNSDPFFRVNRNEKESQYRQRERLSKQCILSKISYVFEDILTFYTNAFLDILRAIQSYDTKRKKWDLSQKFAEGAFFQVMNSNRHLAAYDLIVECKHLNYNYSLEFTMINMASYWNDRYTDKSWVLGEPLTLAYI